ncbi:MAG TPA: hypothetical protein VLR48_10495 [Thiocapsa sp.]|nr:hypothetical protein [Thiocapsa sp.]
MPALFLKHLLDPREQKLDQRCALRFANHRQWIRISHARQMKCSGATVCLAVKLIFVAYWFPCHYFLRSYDRRDSPEAMKNVQEWPQTWETPEIVSQSVPQITVLSEVYMRSP